MIRIAIMPLVLLAAACGSGEDDATIENGAAGEDVVEKMRDAVEEGSLMAPGEYETRVEIVDVEMPGLPDEFAEQVRAAMGKPFRGCLTEADLDRPDESFFAGENSDCSYDKFDMTDGRVNASMRCVAEGSTQRMTMVGQYREDGYDMKVEMTSDDPQSRMSWNINAQRVGNCG